MTKEREIEILMMDKCTKSEAKRHLKNGTVIFEDFEKYFDDYMEEWSIEDDQISSYRKMIEEKIPFADWGIVEDAGNTYYIMYVL